MVEVASALFGLVQGVLILLKRKENWIFYLFNISTLMVYSWSVRLYADVIENGIYLLIGILGALTWSKRFSEWFRVDKIRHVSGKESVFFIGVIILLSSVCWSLVSATDDALPLLDAVTTGMGFVATYMMAMKILEAWVVWFIDDILMLVTYLMLPEAGYYLATLNFIWIFLAIGSYISWRKDIIDESV